MDKYKNPILNEREKTHGNFDHTAQSASYLNEFFATRYRQKQQKNPVREEALRMIASKLARILEGNAAEPDHWRDIAGYAELVVVSLEPREMGVREMVNLATAAANGAKTKEAAEERFSKMQQNGAASRRTTSAQTSNKSWAAVLPSQTEYTAEAILADVKKERGWSGRVQLVDY